MDHLTDEPTLAELIESLELEQQRNPSPLNGKFQLVLTTLQRELDKKADKESK